MINLYVGGQAQGKLRTVLCKYNLEGFDKIGNEKNNDNELKNSCKKYIVIDFRNVDNLYRELIKEDIIRKKILDTKNRNIKDNYSKDNFSKDNSFKDDYIRDRYSKDNSFRDDYIRNRYSKDIFTNDYYMNELINRFFLKFEIDDNTLIIFNKINLLVDFVVNNKDCIEILNKYYESCFLNKNNSYNFDTFIVDIFISFLKEINKRNEVIVISDEIGNGVVPIKENEREYRELNGKLLQGIASEASNFGRIFCGVEQVIKSEKDFSKGLERDSAENLVKDSEKESIKNFYNKTILQNAEIKISMVLIRHGKTKGNLEGRYIGCTDEVLIKEGIDEILSLVEKKEYPTCDFVFSSPMKRCRQTAKIIYDNKEILINRNLKEMNFGKFEMKNYKELNGNEYYQKWIDSNGTIPFPEGEGKEDFIRRVGNGFNSIVQFIYSCKNNFELENENSGVDFSIVSHGGTIMAIMNILMGVGYYEYRVKNAHGYIVSFIYDGNNIKDISIEREI